MSVTKIHSRLTPAQMAKVHDAVRTMDAVALRDHMGKYGIHFGQRELATMTQALFTGDSASYGGQGTFAPSPVIGVPIQFLQEWLQGFVYVMTQPRTIDTLVPMAAAGSWHTEEIVQPMLEHVGTAVPYGDENNIPLANFSPNYNRRTVVRYENGFQVGRLEEARMAEIRIGTAQEKRAAVNISLEIARNDVGFYGFNAPDTRTYGLLNDPMLGAYISLPATGTGGTTQWANKNFLQITADIRLMATRLRVDSRGLVNPNKDRIVFGLPVGAIDYLSVTSDFGNSVQDWLSATYPTWRVEQVIEFDGANGGANVAYLYAENIADSGSDGGSVIEQYVPSKTFMLGVEQRAKGYTEDYSNATAGIMVKRPYAVKRFTGL